MIGQMRSLSAFLAATLAFAGSLFATDLPTVKAPLPALTVAQGGAIPATDLRNFFEVTSIVGQVVQLRTSSGIINIEMLPATAPASVANFLVYVNGGRYANTFIHRSDVGLGVIQGGGYSLSNFAHIATDPPVVLEYNLPNTRGTISMARTATLNSGTSEWFINMDDNTTDLGQSNGGGYAVFGRVTGTGMTVADAIHALPTYAFNSPFGQLPLSGYSGTGNPPVSTFIAMTAAEAVPIFPATAGQNSVVGFSVTGNTNPSLVTATISGSALNLVLAANQSGFADLTVTATDSNGNPVQNSFRLTVPPPEVAVEQPAGSDVADGGSRAFPSLVNEGSSSDLVFTIKNSGAGELALTGTPKVAVDGANAGMFTVLAQPVSPVAPSGGSTMFTVRFSPTSGGAKSAALHIANNDSDEAPFDINLTGTANGLPVFSLPSSPLIVEATAAGGVVVSYNVTANDAEDGVLTPTVSPLSGSIFPIGDTAVNVSATDSRGAQRTGGFTVSVRDTIAPALTVPPNQVVEPASAAGTVVNYPAATATDAVGVTSLTYSKASGTLFPVGVTTVTVMAKDAANHTTAQTFTVTVAFNRPAGTTVNIGARTGETPNGAPAGATLGTFGPPAVNDFRHLAARVTMRSGATTLAGIYLEDETGAGSIAAFQGQAVPGISVAGATFKNFLDPVLAADGSVAFLGKMKGGSVTTSSDSGVWTNAFGSGLELLLREGSDVPDLPGATLKSVSSISLRNGELLALLTLNLKTGVVKEGNDTVLLRMTAAGIGKVLLREGRELAGLPGTKVQTFSVLSPALGSEGHGRWHAEGLVVAKAALTDGRVLIVKIAPDGTATPLLSTADAATPVDPAAKWKNFGLPAVGELGAGFAVAAKLKATLGGVLGTDNSTLLFSDDGTDWSVFAREGGAAPGGLSYATFFDPVVNDSGDAAFLATLQGAGITEKNQTALFGGSPDDPQLLARLGSPVPDESGAATTAVLNKFISFALPGGPDAGVIFLGKTSGGDTTAANKLALWAVDSQGKLRRVLRTGDTLASGGPAITNLALLNAANGAFGVARSYSATRSIALVATFADTTQALLRVDLP